MSIGEVARRAGIRPSALRYYEVLREVLERLAVVRVDHRAGFTISEIRTLLDGFSEDTPPSERWRVLAQVKLSEVEAWAKRALGMKCFLEKVLRCERLRLADCDPIGGEVPDGPA